MKIIVCMFLCFLFMISCTNKKNTNTEIITENEITAVSDKEITDSNIKIINEEKVFYDKLYEHWTLGNRYTTFIYSGRVYDNTHYPNTVMTFIHNLQGFSNVIMIGESRYDDPITTRSYPQVIIMGNNILDIRSRKGVALDIYVFSYGHYFEFDITDDGTIILSRYANVNNDKLNEIHYKYENDELVLFDYYLSDEKLKYQAESIYLENKMVLKDDNGKEIILIKEELSELEALYIKALRERFIYIIDLLPKSIIKYNDFGFPDILGIDILYSLTQKEINIFEECLYEYYGCSVGDDVTGIIDESIFVFLDKLKNK